MRRDRDLDGMRYESTDGYGPFFYMVFRAKHLLRRLNGEGSHDG